MLRKAFFRVLRGYRKHSVSEIRRRAAKFHERVESHARIIRRSMRVSAQQAEFLALLFHPAYYSRHAPAISSDDDTALLKHYLQTGLEENLAPGPFFDPAFCAERLAESGGESSQTSGSSRQPPPSGVMRKWLETIDERVVVPTPLFDARHYLRAYKDVRAAGLNPFYHFLKYGENEGRRPHPLEGRILPAILRERGIVSPTPLRDILTLFPLEAGARTLDAETWIRAKKYFMPAFYKMQHDGLLDELSDDQLLAHFFSVGVFNGFRPTLLFNAPWYRKQLLRWNQCVESGGVEASIPDIAPGVDAFCHWLTLGVDRRIVPTPLFDERHYTTAHKDLKNWKDWSFAHFAQHGCKEKYRQPSPYFSNPEYASSCGKLEHEIIYLDCLTRGLERGCAFHPRVSRDILQSIPHEASEESTPLERIMEGLQSKNHLVDSPVIRDMVSKAAEIEPLVMRPGGERKVSWPPRVHDNVALLRFGKKAREIAGGEPVDTVVLLPHCRQLSGASRIGVAMAKAISESLPDERLVVILTDVHEPVRASWLDENLEVIDFAEHFPPATGPEFRKALLLDMISGLKTRRIINVNSRLGWDLYISFAQQMRTWMNLYAYLFCWDKDARGNKGGYPIRELQMVINDLTGIFFDANMLREEVVDRYALPEVWRKRLHVLLSPAEKAVADMSENLARRKKAGKPLRAFWAARFDRQKRLDVLVEIMRQMPELELWMYGEPVLGGAGVDLDNLPSNIVVKPPFAHFRDLPLEDFDFYLYTSEWDGLPNLIMTAGVNAIPTVASNVGGVGELLNEETGWPVNEALDPSAYVRRIREMVSDPEEARRRALAFREHTRKQCNEERFAARIREILEKERNPPGS